MYYHVPENKDVKNSVFRIGYDYFKINPKVTSLSSPSEVKQYYQGVETLDLIRVGSYVDPSYWTVDVYVNACEIMNVLPHIAPGSSSIVAHNVFFAKRNNGRPISSSEDLTWIGSIGERESYKELSDTLTDAVVARGNPDEIYDLFLSQLKLDLDVEKNKQAYLKLSPKQKLVAMMAQKDSFRNQWEFVVEALIKDCRESKSKGIFFRDTADLCLADASGTIRDTVELCLADAFGTIRDYVMRLREANAVYSEVTDHHPAVSFTRIIDEKLREKGFKQAVINLPYAL
jgi:hypothetical protein